MDGINSDNLLLTCGSAHFCARSWEWRWTRYGLWPHKTKNPWSVHEMLSFISFKSRLKVTYRYTRTYALRVPPFFFFPGEKCKTHQTREKETVNMPLRHVSCLCYLPVGSLNSPVKHFAGWLGSVHSKWQCMPMTTRGQSCPHYTSGRLALLHPQNERPGVIGSCNL